MESLKHDSPSSYCVYGLLLRSDSRIPCLTPVGPLKHHRPVVSVQFRAHDNTDRPMAREDELPWYTSDFSDEHGNPALRIWKRKVTGDYSIRYSHGLEFLANREANSITVDCKNEKRMQETVEFLLGPVLGILLRLRGITCLHGSAVAIGDQAIAFVGPPGAGKSTTAGLFVKSGYAALADDIVPLCEAGGGFEAVPGYPCLNLWQEALEMLDRNHEPPQTAVAAAEKQQLALSSGAGFCDDALRLGAVYVLGERGDRPGIPLIEPMAPQEALFNLVANTYANKLPGAAVRAREFRLLGRLLNQVPVRRIVPHKEPSHLQELREVILEDFSALRQRAFVVAQP